MAALGHVTTVNMFIKVLHYLTTDLEKALIISFKNKRGFEIFNISKEKQIAILKVFFC